MKLVIGEFYLTKEGRRVTITEFDAKNLIPYKGEYENNGGSDRWYEDGLSGYRNGTWTDIISLASLNALKSDL